MSQLKSLILPEGASMTAWVVMGNPWALLGYWLVFINLITFLIFGLDKWKAKRKVRHTSTRRVPEKTLFVLSALGGGVGALLGMKVFHHKTLHKSFRYGIPGILILQIIAAVVIAVYCK